MNASHQSVARYMVLSTVVLLGLAATGYGQAVDIYVKGQKDKPFKSVIQSESVRGIQLAGNNKFISANDLLDINYENRITSTTDRLAIYRPATVAENNAWKARDPKVQAKGLAEAAEQYKTGLGKLDPALKFTKRHFEYKVGFLKAQAALLGGKDFDKTGEEATTELTAFKSANQDSWQYTPAMLMLAELQMHYGNNTAARKLYTELAKTAGVPEDVVNEVTYREAKLLMGENNYTEAQKTLNDLIPKLAKGSLQLMQVRLDEVRCMAELDQRKQAIEKLKAMQAEVPASNKDMKALVYNTLGELHYRNDEMQEARWPFLWVDVIYNDNTEEHAKALYYLHKIFANLREFDRADECYIMLTEDERFASSPYRKLAVEERKKAGG